MKASAGKPDVAIAHGYLYVVYALERGPVNTVLSLRIKLDDPALSTGLIESRRSSNRDRYIGVVKPVSAKYGKNAHHARVRDEAASYGYDYKRGALAASSTRTAGRPLDRNSEQGITPALAPAGSRARVATTRPRSENAPL